MCISNRAVAELPPAAGLLTLRLAAAFLLAEAVGEEIADMMPTTFFDQDMCLTTAAAAYKKIEKAKRAEIAEQAFKTARSRAVEECELRKSLGRLPSPEPRRPQREAAKEQVALIGELLASGQLGPSPAGPQQTTTGPRQNATTSDQQGGQRTRPTQATEATRDDQTTPTGDPPSNTESETTSDTQTTESSTTSTEDHDTGDENRKKSKKHKKKTKNIYTGTFAHPKVLWEPKRWFQEFRKGATIEDLRRQLLRQGRVAEQKPGWTRDVAEIIVDVLLYWVRSPESSKGPRLLTDVLFRTRQFEEGLDKAALDALAAELRDETLPKRLLQAKRRAKKEAAKDKKSRSTRFVGRGRSTGNDRSATSRGGGQGNQQGTQPNATRLPANIWQQMSAAQRRQYTNGARAGQQTA